MAEDYASWSPYNYVLGNPVMLVDPDGRAPEDYPIYGKDGTLIGYVVEPGQGPTQIAEDLNQNYGCEMSCEITYTDIVQDNAEAFPNGFKEDGSVKDKSDNSFKSGNIEPNQKLVINGGVEIKSEGVDKRKEKLKGTRDSLIEENRKLDSLDGDMLMDNYKDAFAPGAFESGGKGAASGRAVSSPSKIAAPKGRNNKAIKALEKEIGNLDQK